MIKKLVTLTSLVVVTTFQANSMDRPDPAIADLQKVRATLTQTINNIHKPAEIKSMEKEIRESAFIIDKFLWEKEGKLSPTTTLQDKLKLFYAQNEKDINILLSMGSSLRSFIAIKDPSKYGNVQSEKVQQAAEHLMEDLDSLKKIIAKDSSNDEYESAESALKYFKKSNRSILTAHQQASAALLDALWTKARILINFDML